MERKLLFNRFREEVEKNTKFALDNFSHLSEPQFNWTPGTDTWSIGQCILHINMTSRHWLKQFEKILKHGVKSNNTGNYKPGVLGNYLVKIITPVATRKFKTPEIFQPHFLVNGKACMDEFMDFQKRFLELADKIKNYDLEKNKLNFPVTSLVHVRLGDAFTIYNQHARRHLNQAMKVMKQENFPQE